MAITFTEHLKTINNALYDLIRAEFTTIKIIYKPEFDFADLAKHGEYIRFYYDNDSFVSRNSDGETRDFSYNLSIYFDRFKIARRDDFEDLYANRVDRLTKLLSQNPTHTVSGSYVWHDLKVAEREYNEFDEDQTNVVELRCQIEITKTTMW